MPTVKEEVKEEISEVKEELDDREEEIEDESDEEMEDDSGKFGQVCTYFLFIGMIN